MSSNKRRDRKGPGRAARALGLGKRAFAAKDGGLRAVWRLALAILAYVVWTNGVTALLSYGFDALFTAWGVTKLNLSAAPGYARFLAANYGNIISVVSSAGIAAFAYLAAPRRDRLRLRARLFGVGTLAGLGAVLVAAAGFLALDSVRMTAASPDFTWSPAVLLPVYLAAAVAEEFFARGYVLSMVSRRGGRPLGYLASAAVFLFMTGGYALGILGILNMLLFSAVLCALSEKWPNWLNVGIRFGWGYAVVCLFAFPGASGGSPIYTLYSVSEDFLTGGSAGLVSGLYMTVFLAATLWFVLLRGLKLRLPFKKNRATQ